MNPDEPAINREDLITNPSPRVPICLCLDTSASMAGDPILELNAGVQLFFDAVRTDEVARHSAEIAVVTFGDRAARLLDFASIERQEAPTLSAGGSTPMGSGVNLALDLLEGRKREYSGAGVDYYQPWLVLMTDGQPTDDVTPATARTVALLERRKLVVFPIGIGGDADLGTLASFSPQRAPLRLAGLEFKAFFSWLSRSVARVSQSLPGQDVPLDVKGIQGWAQL